MTSRPPETGAAAHPHLRTPWMVQILVDLKSADPTAVTAGEAIRTLLGFGQRLVDIRRRRLHEVVCFPVSEPGDPAPFPPEQSPERFADLAAQLQDYLHRTTLLWNPNKHRAWIRLGDGRAWEVLPGKPLKTSAFGSPDLGDEGYDHVLLWNREEGSRPFDLQNRLGSWEVGAFGSGDLYTLRWESDAGPRERAEWTREIAVAESRMQGLLVNPHYQDHRRFQGRIPIPFWSRAAGSSG